MDGLELAAVRRARSALELIDRSHTDESRTREIVRKLGGTFSFSRMLSAMATGQLHTAPVEYEALKEVGGSTFDAMRVHIPWELFERDLLKGTASAGGYLVGSEIGEAVDILRPWSVSMRAGVTTLERLVGDVPVPRTATKSNVTWLSTEGTALTESQPTLGQFVLTPKTAGGFLEFSRQLSKQANAEGYVRRELLRSVGTAVDQAVINGSGAAGLPLGLLSTPGLATQSGTTLAHAGTANMKQQCASANAPDEAIAFLSTPEVRELLETREKATSNGFVWQADRVADRPAFVTTDMPAATMIAGAWLDVILGLWGPGFTFEVNPYDPTGFKAGIIQARVLVSCDVAVQHPSAFCVATVIT